MPEKRRRKRWHLVYYLRLFDMDNDAEVGHVANISTDGLMVVSPWPLPANKAFHLRMALPRPDGGGTQRADFRAQCLWSRPDPENASFHNSGFSLLQARADTTAAIRALIEELEKNDDVDD